ncbi:unnamed protein product [Ostreobium quekettii]|uniref:Chloride channel protein n=1 Tax=Ostreobium quekettii TaxID=121088 RepID=A0A8S1IUA2_9CHLO|nr:unnamed protein product [Ostreobium quekettii]
MLVFSAQDDLQHTCIPEDSDDLSRVIEPVSRLETCIPGGHLSAKQANSYWEQKAKSEGTYVNGSYPVEYNELATLMSLTGEDGIRSLLTRGTHREFSYQALLTMLVWYGVGAALAAGSSISSGLFIPMMMIGALIGRLVGLMTTALVAASTGIINGVFSEDSQFAAIDPGVFAFIGAAAFMGGVTRLTVSLAVIMIEISNDVHMLPPILVAVMIAKWVADSWTHSLYHGLLEVKCVPFLPPQPISKDSLDLMETRAVMHSPVVTMREQMRVAEIKEVLRETSHNGFPIIQDSPHGGVFGGLITRHHLLVLLRALRSRGSTGHLSVSYDELKRRNVTAKARREVSEQQRALQIGNNGDHSEGDSSDELLDLGMYINRSAMKVQESFSVERTYILFRTMGLRHLVVVDEHNHVKGIVTRKDLLGFRLDDAATREEIRGSGDWDL